jgi:hypothetical protein
LLFRQPPASWKRTATGFSTSRNWGVQIAVSPDLFARVIKTYDAVLREALSRGWITKADDFARWQITVLTVQLRLAVTEKIEPIPGMLASAHPISGGQLNSGLPASGNDLRQEGHGDLNRSISVRLIRKVRGER